LGDDDGEYFSRVILASDGIRFVPEARMFYRRVPGTLSYVGRSDRKVEAHFSSMQLHIGHIRAAEDSARVRSACLKYLQGDLIYFYPERPDLVKRAEQLAADLGGRLEVPRLQWKYAWMQRVFGWGTTKRIQIYYNRLKFFGLGTWDKTLFRLGI
jgi:hypothetical protein